MLSDRLATLARDLGGGDALLLSDRVDGLVVRAGDVVVKAHPADSDPDRLLRRLRAAASGALRGVLLAPLPLPDGGLMTRVEGRILTAWPAGEPVDPDDPAAVPWETAGHLLARLHRTPVPDGLPPHGAPARVARALDRMARQADTHPAASVVRAALATLPAWTYQPSDRPGALTHGDWHLGQLVRVPDRGWLLVDVDDLGHGDPVWDLARPASWYATGLMPPDAWRRFVDAYRAAGGPAIPPTGDPWPSVDVVARALVVQAAALAVASASRQSRALDEVEQVIVDTCRRIVDLP